MLRRPKFAAYVDERTVREFVERIPRHATVVNDPVGQPAVTRDRKDDYLVALARSEPISTASRTELHRSRRVSSARWDGSVV